MISSPANELIGHTIVGKKTGARWFVREKMEVPQDRSGGAFSVGYRVANTDGKEAFMKAADLSLLTEDNGGLFERWNTAFQAHKFERDILDYCQGSKMDRIVVAIDYGDAVVTFDDRKEPLFYLIFELADHDVRGHADKRKSFGLAWCLGALHELAVGVQQLHRGSIAHNDIKPSNFLIFGETLQKLADLGCATAVHLQAQHSVRHDPGDPKYAAPELLFSLREHQIPKLCEFSERRRADLYNFGSMIYFMFTGVMLTPQIVSRLSFEHRPPSHSGGWNGSFEGVEPYWREAFTRVMSDFRSKLTDVIPSHLAAMREDLAVIVSQLCEPVPTKRGHPSNRSGNHDPLGVDRYISAFQLMRKQAEIKIDG